METNLTIIRDDIDLTKIVRTDYASQIRDISKVDG